MSLVINNNMMAANTARTLNSHYGRLAQSAQRLSSGLRINSAADDAAGLAIRELQRADIAALQQGTRNANDAISLIQTADGALGIIDEKLIRMKELAEQASTGTYDSTQRLMISSEFQEMAREIHRIAHATDFNGIKLLDGSLDGEHDGSGLTSTGAMKIHFGSSNSSAEDYYYINAPSADLLGLGLGGYLNVGTDIIIPQPNTNIFHVTDADITQAAQALAAQNDLTIDIDKSTFTGHKESIGLFENGYAAGVNIGNGIILSSGKVKDAENPPGFFASTEHHTPGNAELDAIITPEKTYDAGTIDIEFTSDTGMIYFNIVFATEEFPDYLNTKFNDVCGIFIDGTDCTKLDHVVAIDGVEVESALTGDLTINNIFSNKYLYVDNTNGDNLFSAGGYNKRLTFGVQVQQNIPHTLKITVADTAD